MPLFIASLIGALIDAAFSIFGKILLGLGVGFISYSGIQASLDWLMTQVQSSMAGLPPMVLQGAGMLKIDVSISILFSALTIRLMLKGMDALSGSIKRPVLK